MSISLLLIHRVTLQAPAAGGVPGATTPNVPARVEKAIQELQVTFSHLGATDLVYFDADHGLTLQHTIVYQGNTYALKQIYNVGNLNRIWQVAIALT